MADALGAGFRQSVFMVADELGFDLDPSCAPRTRWRWPPRPSTRPSARYSRARWRPSGSVGRAWSTASRWSRPPSTGSWVRRTSTRPGASVPPASASRSRSPAIPTAWSRFKKLHPVSVEAGLVRNPGIVATALHCVNAIPYVCAGPARPAHLPRPAPGGRAGRPGPSPERSATGARATDDPGPVRHRGPGGRRHRRRAGHRAGHRRRLGRSRRRRRPGGPDRDRSGGGGRTGPGSGRRALVVPTDVLDDQALLEDLVGAAVEEFGRLDILVNNAGGAMPRAAMDTSEGFMARTFAFNVTAPLTLTKLAARAMVDTVGRGAVVNISSRSASMTQTMFVAYGVGQGGPRPHDPQHRARVGAAGPGQRHRRGRRGHPVARGRADRRRPAPPVPGRHPNAAGPANPRTSPAPCCTWCRTPRRGSPARCSRSMGAPRPRLSRYRRHPWSPGPQEEMAGSHGANRRGLVRQLVKETNRDGGAGRDGLRPRPPSSSNRVRPGRGRHQLVREKRREPIS